MHMRFRNSVLMKLFLQQVLNLQETLKIVQAKQGTHGRFYVAGYLTINFHSMAII